MKKFVLIAVLVVILDQITKFLMKDVHYGIFNYVTNSGAAFSLFKGYTIVLSVISIAVIVFLLYFYKKYPKLWLSLGFILGGTIGNLIDRIIFGHVRDFIDLTYWPIFNVADSFNVIGVCIICYLVVLRNRI
nr:signal peptidase II [Nanoarchaeum sp.]